jgi:DNA-binding protein YbaB
MSHPNDSVQNWARMAADVQEQLNLTRSRLQEAEVTGTSGRVTVTLGVTGDLRDIRMDQVGLNDLSHLRHEILTAHERAVAAIRERAAELIGPVRELVSRLDQAPM